VDPDGAVAGEQRPQPSVGHQQQLNPRPLLQPGLHRREDREGDVGLDGQPGEVDDHRPRAGGPHLDQVVPQPPVGRDVETSGGHHDDGLALRSILEP
jgi:hypothetical protein